MRFSLFHHVPWPDDRGHATVLAEATEQVQRAEALGFHGVWLAEHHFGRYGLASASLLFATHLAARTERIRIGTGITIASIRHPLLVAEESAMLDVLSGGRLDFGVGVGGDVELQAFGVPPGEARARFAEVTEMLVGLWTQDAYSHEGTFFRAGNLSLSPRPLQQPHPPLYAAVRSAESIDLVLRRGMIPMTGVLPDTADAIAARPAYAAAATRLGVPFNPGEMPFFRYVYVGDSEEEIRRDTEGPLRWVWDCLDWQRRQSAPESAQHVGSWLSTAGGSTLDYDQLRERKAFFGTPAQLRDRIRELRDCHGVTHFGGNFGFGGLEQGKVLRSMERFAHEVMPGL